MISADMLKDKTFDQTVNILSIELNDEQIESLFLKNLSPVVKEFLRGEMSAPVHPVIRRILGRRVDSPVKEIPSKLPQAEKIVAALLAEGRIKATHTQAYAVLKKLKIQTAQIDEIIALLSKNRIIYTAPDGSNKPWQESGHKILNDFFKDSNLATAIIDELTHKTIQTNITWALELGDPNKLRDAVEKYWLREPDPSIPKGYREALKAFQAGKNPLPDDLVKYYQAIDDGQLSLSLVSEYSQALLEKECEEIRNSVLLFIHGKTGSIEKIVGDLYAAQMKIIVDKERTGTYFLLNDQDRLNRAFNYLKEVIRFEEDIDQAYDKIKRIEISSPMGGKLLFVTDKKTVKKGELIAIVEAAKMENRIIALDDGGY